MKIISLFLLFIVLATACSSLTEPEAVNTEPLGPKLEKLKLLSGFKAEHLYSPSENEQGSWVSMTFDDKGRLITSDQYGWLYRLELPAIGDTIAPTVEKLNINMGYAQGLLWAFNSLYVVVNHKSDEDFEKGSGLYRIVDSNQNDVLDSLDDVTLLKAMEGRGEHGPHSIILGPDEQSLYFIAGNHTDVPEMDDYIVPSVWESDNLFPLVTDPRGHAADREPPGGWIARLDSLGTNWELFSVGYRNAFDIAFNEQGDLFTYDSDMEWDLGMPWYRPTRICHITSGSEFGWRTGTGKWPVYYPDNLPPLLNIGQGSPTGVIYGENARFPEKYRKALYAFDWSFGIIYAIHMQPDGASYQASREEFISGMPLPLTDGVIGPDGAMYFMTGGRRLESDLYRVYASDYKDVAVASVKETSEETEAHAIRVKLENYHKEIGEEAIDIAWPYLNHPDRFVRYAARIAIEHQPAMLWQEKAINADDPQTLIQGTIALARQGNQSLQSEMLQSLVALDYDALPEETQLDLIRAFELTFVRMGAPAQQGKSMVIDYLSPHYPASTDALNRELAKVLAFLESPQVVEKTLVLLETKREKVKEGIGGETATDASDLILRNPQYGMDIARTLESLPDPQHTFYATVLSSVNSGWNPDLRERYFKWFYNAFNFQAGNSYIGYINQVRLQALENVPEDKLAHYKEISGDSLLTNSGKTLADLPEPEGPGKRWEMEDIDTLIEGSLANRDFERGRNMYLATRCASCHLMRGEGGMIGPDLTQLGTRFSQRDMLEAIIEPNAVISDQYAATVLYLEDGTSVVGRLTDQDEDFYYLSQNPFAPNVIREVPKEDVTEEKLSAMSVMPPGMINRLNEEELKDLLAYLMAGGNENHEVFAGSETE